MASCYSCGDPIDKSNISFEHIINNGIGGSIGSNDLLCRGCNGEFGETIDRELSQQLGVIAILLDIKRDRKSNERSVTMVTASGKTKEVGPGMRPYTKLSFPAAEKQIELFTSEKKYPKLVRNKTRELSKKQKVIFIESTELPTKEKYFIKNRFYDEAGYRQFGGFTMLRSVVKMCVNRYISRGYDPKYCQSAIAFIKGKEKPNPHYYFFPKNASPHELTGGEVSHILHICGDRRNRVIYCYIELFNFENAIVMFDMDYDGEDFSDTYAIDTFSGEEIAKKINIRLARNHFEDLHFISSNFEEDYVSRYNRILQIIESRQVVGFNEDKTKV